MSKVTPQLSTLGLVHESTSTGHGIVKGLKKQDQKPLAVFSDDSLKAIEDLIEEVSR